MPESPRRIKRYPNRRLYDTVESKYISLSDIEAMVRQGQTVEIIDSQSGEDMTRIVLTQIILDRQPEKMALFPSAMLHSIVRSNDLVAGFLRDYFQNSLTYLEYLQQHGAGAQDLANPMHWVQAWMDSMKPAAEPPPPPVEEPPAEADPVAQKIADLEERIRQLESQQE